MSGALFTHLNGTRGDPPSQFTFKFLYSIKKNDSDFGCNCTEIKEIFVVKMKCFNICIKFFVKNEKPICDFGKMTFGLKFEDIN